MRHDLLIKSTIKLIELTKIEEWNNELLDKAPPIIWFGNSKSEKSKILTIGGNPSRQEFLDKSVKKKITSTLQKTFYETKYLKKKRLYQLDNDQNINDILISNVLRNKIIDSFDKYFSNPNSYNWFGSNKYDSYNVEGVLRGMDTSYFEINSKYRACHIDLFPFTTISDFNKIQPITQRDILVNFWAKNIVDDLLKYFRPNLLLIFGITNFNYFCKYFNIDKGIETIWHSKKWKGKCKYWQTKYSNYKVIGISANLGNPIFFDANGLKELGEDLKYITSL